MSQNHDHCLLLLDEIYSANIATEPIIHLDKTSIIVVDNVDDAIEVIDRVVLNGDHLYAVIVNNLSVAPMVDIFYHLKSVGATMPTMLLRHLDRSRVRPLIDELCSQSVE